MFSSLRKFTGLIQVEEVNDLIEISGIPVTLLLKHINRQWKTARFEKFMFTELGSSYISFNKFFLPDFVYLMERLLDNRTIRVRTAATIRKLLVKIFQETWIKSSVIKHDDILNLDNLKRLKWEANPTQLAFLKSYNENVPKLGLNGYLAAMPPGTGKTFTGLATAECLDADLVIVVCPKNAVTEVWEKTIRDQYGSSVGLWSSKTHDKVDPDPNIRFHIFHFETIGKAIDLCNRRKSRKPVIILDECHNFNELVSQRTQLFMTLSKVSKSKNILWMSGTPVKAMGREVVPLLTSIDPLFDADASTRFMKVFGLSSARGLDILEHRLGYMMFKVPKSVVVDGEPITEEISVKLPNAQRYTLDSIRADIVVYIKGRYEYYQKNLAKYHEQYFEVLAEFERMISTKEEKASFELYKKYATDLHEHYDAMSMGDKIRYCNKYEKEVIYPMLSNTSKKTFNNVRTIYKCLHLKIQGEALGNVLGKRRAECHTAMVRVSMPQIMRVIDEAEKKTVIFSSFVDTLKECVSLLEKEKYKTLLVIGETNNELEKMVKLFDEDDDVNPLNATYKSLSTAVPLVMANTVILIDKPYRQYIYDQSTSRVHRLGQDSQTYIYTLVLDTGTEPNISTRSADILEWSRQQVEAILGEEGGYVNAGELVTKSAMMDPSEGIASLINRIFASVKSVFT